MNNNEYIIVVKDLNKSFGNQQVLENINFSLKKNDNLVILGRSGTGKTVLLKCIIGLIKPDKGEVIIYNNPIFKLDNNKLRNIRKKIGFVFQNAALFDYFTVYENLKFLLDRNFFDMNDDEKHAHIMSILEKVGLEKSYTKYPEELSGGMKKRAGIARALILNPEIVLYDEPTAGLDYYTSLEISKLIKNLKDYHNTSSIIVTHDLKCAEITADKVMVLSKKNIIFEGLFNEFMDIADKIFSNG